ncbi:hypothetical protein [Caenispirillum salinarum]|uniref:hypothetical protein n=1 Tax=Caenispirillum salinarum TaxID=859058 RepID=UPI0038508C16
MFASEVASSHPDAPLQFLEEGDRLETGARRHRQAARLPHILQQITAGAPGAMIAFLGRKARVPVDPPGLPLTDLGFAAAIRSVHYSRCFV